MLLLAAPAHADVRIAIGNDVLSPPIDDSGFTNDIEIRSWRSWGRDLVGGMLRHRWITEVGGPRRWDEVELAATLERAWPWGIAAVRLGPTFGGNLGGRRMQNGWHVLTRTGPTLGEGLQDIYPGDNTYGGFAGARATRSVGAWVQAYAVLDGQVALGTGVTYGEGAGGGRVVTHLGPVELGAHAEVAIARYHVTDDGLALPGGYRRGWQGEWRAGVRVAWCRYIAEYEYRQNEGGSGEPIGMVAFTVRSLP